jgi:hypothetical protein
MPVSGAFTGTSSDARSLEVLVKTEVLPPVDSPATPLG